MKIKSTRRFIFIMAGATSLTAGPPLLREVRKRGEDAMVVSCDYDLSAIATATQYGFTTVELEWAGAYPAKRIKATRNKLGRDVNAPIVEPRNNPHELRPIVETNLDKLEVLYEASVRDMGERGSGELFFIIVYSPCGPTSSTTALVVAPHLKILKRQWQARYP
jgi:hypothetical protein